jgi:SAM-dependent methyltransferase
MSNIDNKTGGSAVNDYEINYIDLHFENVLREFRKKNIYKLLNECSHKRVLEIGCGPEPLFKTFFDFDKMTIVEPSDLFCKMAVEEGASNSKIHVLNDRIENIAGQLMQDSFDFIIIGGFLHEIDNPEVVLRSVRNISSKNTIIYSFVPNARSFHRLLAYEMGLISSIYQKSEHDLLFQRRSVFDVNGFNELLIRSGFRILNYGSYFIKPFTHDQMNKLLNSEIIDKCSLIGLDKMIKYLPELGAELWNTTTIDD